MGTKEGRTHDVDDDKDRTPQIELAFHSSLYYLAPLFSGIRGFDVNIGVGLDLLVCWSRWLRLVM
jgi:hypothetical protein